MNKAIGYVLYGTLLSLLAFQAPTLVFVAAEVLVAHNLSEVVVKLWNGTGDVTLGG
jgi:hypothetical protein